MTIASEKLKQPIVEEVAVYEGQHGTATSDFVTKVASIKVSLNSAGSIRIMVWGMLIAWIGAMAQAASLAEMASIQPIAGAQYHWTWAFAPAKPRRFLTWLQGYVTWFAYLSLMCSIAQLTSSIFLSLASFMHPSYDPQSWHLVLVIYLLLIWQALMNIFAFKWVPLIEMICTVLQIALFIVYICVFASLGEKHSASYVWTFFQSTNGWASEFVSWNVGLLSCVWLFIGFDSVIHMSEETRQSRHTVPKAMFWSIAVNGLLAFAMAVVIMFASGSLDDLVASDLPILVILQKITGSANVTVALMAITVPVYVNCGMAGTGTVSRLTWAWARDGGLHPWFAKVSPTLGVPIQAVVLVTVLVMLLALLNLGPSAAFGAIVALSSMAMYFSYFVAIACFVWARYRKGTDLKMGSWDLGRAGIWVNAYALLYTAWIFVFLPWPNTLPVSASNLNYAGPIFLGCVGFACITWFAWARKNWPGLREDIVEFVLAAEKDD
ncbi:putative amino-acid permease C15C4.04c [Pseudocercospora fuligena]|uniref:Putative amino-acid permease C15C4.04c n=1 Tax=Pseudocercospora fuligena TaxID=685502 RepID=A0A8H6VEQ6_9PEZI|nr:putative amino-acid permease C15C4.04c [Pseudocercospora fuligena]